MKYREILIAITLVILVILALWAQGCTTRRCAESLTLRMDEQTVAEYESEVTQTLFLYVSKNRQVEHRSLLSALSVGSSESKPDPNSVRAGIEGVIKGIKRF